MLLAAATGVLLTTGYAVAANTQQEKMKSCNAEVTAQRAQRQRSESVHEDLLSAGGESSQPKNAQQEKMKTCNADANAQNLKGADRKAFMKSCLSAK